MRLPFTLPKLKRSNRQLPNTRRCPHCRTQITGAKPWANLRSLFMGAYELKTCRHSDTDGSAALSIHRKGRRLFYRFLEDSKVSILDSPEKTNDVQQLRWEYPGTDATGDGVPNLVVTLGYCGIQCNGLVFHLGKRFKVLFNHVFGHRGESGEFRDLDGDGVPELIVHSFGGFGSRKLSPVGSLAQAKVVLTFKRGAYRVQVAAMRKPIKSRARLTTAANELRTQSASTRRFNPQKLEKNGNWATPFPELIGEMLLLMYTGQARQARQFLDRAWSPKNTHKIRFLRWFKRKLRKGRYWTELKKHKDFSDLSP